ncbi:MAG: hypothetical protein P8Y53_02400 [Pseudolabrys sp.]|jgi:hypothetical protein
MRRGHEHEQHHSGNGAAGGGNRPPARLPTAQWQAPQRTNGYEHYYRHAEADLDAVESAFAEGFADASDPASFLRLACIPFEATDGTGEELVLLRVECETAVVVGKAGRDPRGGAARYTPLPKRMATRRRRLRFVYFDGSGPRVLSLEEVRDLTL